jgi:hypothetical protein
MSVVRRHLRRGASLWLVYYALTFTALVPRDCCAAHAHAAESHDGASEESAGAPPCHETAETSSGGGHTEMPVDGAACPMHAAGTMPADCEMSGVCDAPEAALAAILLQWAVPVSATTLPQPLIEGDLYRGGNVSAASLAIPPDAPPPRL